MKIVDLKHKSWLTLQIEKIRFIFVGLSLQSVLNMFVSKHVRRYIYNDNFLYFILYLT